MFNQFTHLYPVTKTLRFELKPVGKTLAYIQTKGFIDADQQKADSYKKIKKTIDEYHKDFINRALVEVELQGLADFQQLYLANKTTNDDKLKKAYIKEQDSFRKQIVSGFKTDKFKTEFKELFGKELITKNLPEFVANHKASDGSDLFFVNEFDKFTTYFSGFHENRKNIYSHEDKHTALAFRLIHENLPKYLENILALQVIQENFPDLFDKLDTQFQAELQTMFAYLSSEITLADMLTAEFYNKLLTQRGIDAYNQVIGGRSGEAGDKKLQGLNELINLYNQQLPKDQKRYKAPKLKQLYKQILSDRSSVSFLPEQFADDGEVYQAINDLYLNHLMGKLNETQADSNLDCIHHLIAKLSDYEVDKIYIKNDGGLNDIARALFKNYAVFSIALARYYETHVDPDFSNKYAKAKNEGAREKLDKLKNSFIKGYHSIATIEQAYANYVASFEPDNPLVSLHIAKPIQHYFTNFCLTKAEEGKQAVSLVKAIDNKHSTIKGVLNTSHEQGSRQLLQKGKEVADVKHFLDAVMAFLHFVKPLALSNEVTLEQDGKFYNEFMPLYEELKLCLNLYNKVRNYISQKPYSVEKFKLNFDNAQLLNGWDANKEKDYLSILLLRDGHYYLAIMNKDHKKIFAQAPDCTANPTYQKMRYKLLPGANKMLPKVFFSKKNIDFFAPSAELLANYKNETHKKGDNFNLEHCHQLIDFFKESLAKHQDWQEFDFNFSPTSSYQDLSDFYKEVAHQGYKISFNDIDADYIDSLVDEGKLYLFKIYNKDFSKKAHGKPNLHTLYFKALFTEDNLANTVYKLNGEAELFYRKSSIDPAKTVVHKKGERVHAKNPNTPNASRVLDYEIVKDRRFTVDKFMFHVPITMNFKADGIGVGQLNSKVREALHEDTDKAVNVIGIDRGERHLLYITVINQRGEIIHQESLNSITSDDKQITTPYHTLLDNREKERDDARKNWGVIENIKELKSGYLSQVVHKLTNLMMEHNAIVVLEDLNFGFKRGRFKVEKQVYQKFEKALIDKLNYLVLKDWQANELAGIRKALQLTTKFTAFKDLGKQSGFLFYVPAWNTSKIDPATGFVDLLKPRYESVDTTGEFINNFERIIYNADKGYFEFAFDYNNFTSKAEDTRTAWVICSHGKKRYVYDKNANMGKGGQKQIDVNAELKALFDKYEIDYQTGDDLRPFIIAKGSKDLLSGIVYLLKALLAMRYSKASRNPDEVEDFILSPVADEHGSFFDSRLADDTMPKDADANGAYHIALKGLWVLDNIQASSADDGYKVNLAIKNKDWLNYAQNKPYQNK